MLFKDAPDLLHEFKDFLPEAVPSSQTGNHVGIFPTPAGSSAAWGSGDAPAPEKAKTQRRRKRPADKEAPSTAKAAGGRVCTTV